MNILVVEDNTVDRKLLTAVLSSSGHFVRGNTSAEEAIDEIKARRPDVILLDLKLPGLNGLELARRLKRDPETNQIPIIAITAATGIFSKDEALAAGCDAFIAKPMDTRNLTDRIQGIVRPEAGAPEQG